MAKDTKIQWCDATFNPWEGCTKVAPECKNCYAETLVDHRFGRAKWGKGQPRRRTSAQLWKQPLTWNAAAGAADIEWCDEVCAGGGGSRMPPVRPRVFCLSLGDWLDEEVPIEWFMSLLTLTQACKNLDWQLLTKRPQNWETRLNEVVAAESNHVTAPIIARNWLRGIYPENVWIGVSAGADQRAALEIPAKVHFLSCEPMLHDLSVTHARGFDWIIFGGESGKNARPLKVDWIREGVRFCSTLGIACFVKQLGRNVVDRNDAGFDGEEGDWPMGTDFRELDSGYQGAPVRILLKDSHGGDMSEWPEDLRVREFPKS